jgi:hypothetical protein
MSNLLTNQEPNLIPGELELWTLPVIRTMNQLGDKVKDLQGDVPSTAFNGVADSNTIDWPIAYIDASLVISGNALESPQPIEYLEGYPTCNGIPLWERLENEPVELFKLFKAYRDMKTNQGIRSIQELSRLGNTSAAVCLCALKLFHWNLRCGGYDLYQNILKQHMKVTLVEELQDEHRKEAKELRFVATKYLKENKELMSPKNAIDLLKLATELERLSVGLAPNKVEGTMGMNLQPTVNITNNMGTAGAGNLSSGKGGPANGDQLEAIITVLEKVGALNRIEQRGDTTVIDVTGEQAQ